MSSTTGTSRAAVSIENCLSGEIGSVVPDDFLFIMLEQRIQLVHYCRGNSAHGGSQVERHSAYAHTYTYSI